MKLLKCGGVGEIGIIFGIILYNIDVRIWIGCLNCEVCLIVLM